MSDIEHHPLDDCMLFIPSPTTPGQYEMLRRGLGWGPCTQEQSTFLEANKVAHVPAGELRCLGPEDRHTSWGGLKAFGVFVFPGLVRKGARKCSNCLLPGHNRRTCRLPPVPELVEV